MSDPLAEIKERILARPDADQRELLGWLRQKHPIHELEAEFGAPAEVILEAISRASDLSRRGVLGLIAEASFKVSILDRLEGWTDVDIVGDTSYDFLIRCAEREVRIQVKRQRLERGKPKHYPGCKAQYVAETQRSRTGKDRKTGEDTRPYRFGDFDVLAVCMQPVTGDWTNFRYTPAAWLVPRTDKPDRIKTLQPVSLEPNQDWTDSLATCLRWLDEDREHTIAERTLAE